MSEAILLTGKRGEGKSLSAVKMIRRRLAKGRIVATNLDLNLDVLAPVWNKTPVYRLPDVPHSSDLLALPVGNPNPTDESKNGLLVLDECAAFLNSREWQDKDRLKLISWLAQSRKYGWDLVLIAQGAEMVDSQIRKSLCDLLGIVKRTDKISIPFITWFMLHYFDVEIRMPKLHVATFYYGFGRGSPTAFTDIFAGGDLYAGYNTIQKINTMCKDLSCDQVFGSGLATMLPAWHLKGRYMSRFQMYAKIAGSMLVFGLILGGVGGFAAGYLTRPKAVSIAAPSVLGGVPPSVDETVSVLGVMQQEGAFTVSLSDGRIETTRDYRMDDTGSYFKVGQSWYKSK